MCHHGARLAGCTTIIAVDVKANRLEVAQELGATHVINAVETDSEQGAVIKAVLRPNKS